VEAGIMGLPKIPERKVAPMTAPRGPHPVAVVLSAAERQALELLVHRHSTPQELALRARVVLAAATGLNNAQIARQLGLSLDMARLWRRRWLACQAIPLAELSAAARLADAPRSGAPGRFSAEQWCQLMAMACEIPVGSDVPISHWAPRDIVAEAKKRGIVARISPRHVGRFLKRCRFETA
jgi:putative transposase